MRQRWLSRRALLLHLTLMVVAPGCLFAGWWQATQAMAGNTLSYVYAVEWPVFAVFAGVVWWTLVHDEPDSAEARALRTEALKTEQADGSVSRSRIRNFDQEDEDLAAYNDYLAGLATSDQPKTWRNPWRPPSETRSR